MRINKFIAQATGISRRSADKLISGEQVLVNGQLPTSGQDISNQDSVLLDGRSLSLPISTTTIMLNKPAGFVVSRRGQGSRTIYELLPAEFQQLKPIGRLDKDSSGLLLLSNDGQLANTLTHPSYQKTKVYQVTLHKPLQPLHQQMISDHGIQLDDGLSKFLITRIARKALSAKNKSQTALDPTNIYEVQLQEGRNRQIRRTFAALGYTVITLHRTHFGQYALTNLGSSHIQKLL